MANDPWKEIDEDDIKSGAHRFREILKQTRLDPSLADEVMTQIGELANERHNIIFVFSDGNWAVTGIHVPDEALGDEEGPVLMRGANPQHIIAAFAQSEIRKKIRSLDELEIITGLPQESDDYWAKELEGMAQSVMLKLKDNPPESWDDLLKDEND